MKKLWMIVLLLPVGAWAQEGRRLTEKEAQAQLAEYREKLKQVNAEISELEAQVNRLQARASENETCVRNTRQEIERLKAEIAKYPTQYTVQKGDYLSKIAGMRYIYNNPKAWPRIWRANRDKIKNPNLIYPGWVLTIPRGLVKEFEVLPGDNLWKIAGFSWIYGNPRKWTKIYEANRDKIKNPNLIYPGWILKIPRD